jgi:outer membrane receptor for ferrienterochelin and colicins
MKNLVLLLIACILHGAMFAQQVRGIVFEKGEPEPMPLPGVNVYWSGTQEGTTTDEAGAFRIPYNKKSGILVFSFVGYVNDSIAIGRAGQKIEHVFDQNLTLEEVEVVQRAKTAYVSRMSVINSITITSGELTRAACCNLSESFETSASVDVSYSDAVTGAKQIELLGLAGIYTQMLGENIPNLRGLATSYGLMYIPGSWMESIQVSKGTSSVLNGYESISGQINVEFKKPMHSERLFLNLYQSHMGRSEANFNFRQNLSPKLSTMLLGHVSNQQLKHDGNHDGFIDEPLFTQYNLFNRWDYNARNFEFQFGLKALIEDRDGGQLQFEASAPRDTANGYGIGLDTRRYETFLKTGFIFNRPGTSLGIQQQLTYHDLNSFFGLNDYKAGQTSYYANVLFQSFIADTRHTYTTGFSFMFDRYREDLNDSVFDRTEQVPGAFFQYAYSDGEQLNLILGLRADHHNEFGLFFTPRLHLRYGFNEHTIMRLSAGKGFRSANVLAENTSLLASARKVVFLDTPSMEEAWNYGINLSKHIDISNRELTLSVDLYRTDFVNQVIVDRDSDISRILVYNLTGRSRSNSLQLEANYELLKGLSVTAAFRVNDVKMTFADEFSVKPLVNKYKGMLSLSYVSPLRKWQFDFTSQFNGQSRLPETSSLPENHRMPEYSPAYTILNAQVTKYFRKWNAYLGAENLTNFTQKHPIIAPEKPFGNHFDSSMVWGPIYGIKAYIGLRYTIE